MKKTALVISSGGARGLAAIGVIEEMERQGYVISSVAGCSIGSLVGGMYASGNLNKFKNWILKLDKKDVFRLMDFTFSSQGILKGKKVFEELNKIIGDVNIEDLRIPFSAVAVDLNNHKEVVFRSGSLLEAIRASSSIPSIVTPIKKENQMLVDGGILNPLPLSIVEKKDNDLLVGIDLNAFEAKKDPSPQNYFVDYDKYIRAISQYLPLNLEDYTKSSSSNVGSYFDITSRTFQIMQDKIIADSIDLNKPDLVIKIPRNSCSLFDFFKANELIDLGEKLFKHHKLK